VSDTWMHVDGHNTHIPTYDDIQYQPGYLSSHVPIGYTYSIRYTFTYIYIHIYVHIHTHSGRPTTPLCRSYPLIWDLLIVTTIKRRTNEGFHQILMAQ
jgi:hypothetical protein